MDIDVLTQDIKYEIPYHLRIRENVSLNKCLSLFFYKYQRIVFKYQDLISSIKFLPYKKIKRFIFTAYNNLIELDMHINDKNLLKIKNSLEELEYYYLNIIKETKHPIEILLEKVFLNKQSDYLKINSRFENNKNIISMNMSKAKGLENDVKKLELELSNIKNKKSNLYIEKENELKTYKKTYVDLIDEAQNLKDENKQLVDDLIAFKEFYKQLFKEIFIKKSDMLLYFLQKELNVITYDFDVILWENAKKSKSIQHFFSEAEIEGSYSTKTFIKYYLKNLNAEKMNKQDEELLEIYNSLNIFSKTIILFDRKRSRAKEITSFIENLDHDINVITINELKELVLYIKDNHDNIDYLFLEIEKESEKKLNKIVSILQGLNVEIILYSENYQKDGVISEKELNYYIKEII